MPSDGSHSDSSPSDVKLASDTPGGLEAESQRGSDEVTIPAPSLPRRLPPLARPVDFPSVDGTHIGAMGLPDVGKVLAKGDRIDDFEVEGVLGRGAFGVVYLARQISLDRQVALKVAANTGSEARTMSRLEHDHIVQVFSESVDSTGALRLLCMQLVPGAPLDAVIHDLAAIRRDRGDWTGLDVLTSVDTRSQLADTFNSSALHDRQELAKMDQLEATCWIGARIAEAVDFAHQRGVLHRDIKPANVLVNRYGRPLLADFNISFQALDNTTEVGDRFGGTLAYMSPEHLDAFHPSTATTAEAVDEKSDIYSLGIVLHELLTGEFPLASPPRSDNPLKNIERLAAVRSIAAPPVIEGPGDARKAFSYIIARCLEPRAEDRYASGAELAAALDGCRQLRRHERMTRTPSPLLKKIKANPVRWVIYLALLPQFFGSVFNIWYNLGEIVGRLTPEQHMWFERLVLIYNAIAYPAAVVAGTALLVPLARVWKELCGTSPVDEARLVWSRRRSLSLPVWLIVIAALGWLPGGIIFPFALHMLSPPVSPWVYIHFLTSFAISGMIAVAYSLCGVHYVATRGLYIRMWPRTIGFRDAAGKELGATRRRLDLMQVLAFAIPTIGTVALIWSSDSNDWGFKLITGSLLLGGAAGAGFMWPITLKMRRFIELLSTDHGTRRDGHIPSDPATSSLASTLK